jgi:hypothetical protein
MLRWIYRLFFTVVGKLLQEFALIAALLSLAQVETRYIGRIIAATFALLAPLQAFGLALYRNTPFPTVMADLKAGIDAALDGMTQSITQNPQPAFVAFILTYAIYKLAAFFCRMARSAVPKHSKHQGRPLAGKPAEGGKASISRQLYDDQASNG